MTIQAKVDTILKAKLLPSGMLAANERVPIKKGQTLQVSSVFPAKDQHLELTLIDHKFDRGYVYAPHWNYQADQIILPASYYYQTDNPSGEGFRECCGTSNAMMLNYLLNGWLDEQAQEDGIKQPESIYLAELANEGDTTDHGANTRALRRFGVESYWATNLTFDFYYKSIRNNIPVVMGLVYKGPNHGHVVCGVGFKLRSKIIVHDPYGAREGATNFWLSNLPEAGKNDEYTVQTLSQIWLPEVNDGHGRVVTAIKGVKTVFG